MGYAPQSWVNNDLTRPISADRLNHIEAGIFNANNIGTISPVGVIFAEAGDSYFDTAAGRLYRGDGVGWIIMAEPNQTYTPTLTNMSVGNGSNVLNYHRCDGYLDFTWVAILGSSGFSVGTGPVFTLPVAMAYTAEIMFPASLLDSGVARYLGFAVTNAANSLVVATFASSMSPISTTVPFTWGLGDQMTIRGRYPMTTRYS